MKKLFVTLMLCIFLTNFIAAKEADFLKLISTETHKQVRDINSDGKVNCIDYAVMFKHLWDLYSDYGNSMNCQIVRNKNVNTGFHHLFVRVRSDADAEWQYIEPQATYPDLDMFDYWGWRYDSDYNIYFETYIWLTI